MEVFRQAALEAGKRLRGDGTPDSKVPEKAEKASEPASNEEIAITVATRIAITMQSERDAKLEKMKNQLGLEHQAFIQYIRDTLKEDS